MKVIQLPPFVIGCGMCIQLTKNGIKPALAGQLNRSLLANIVAMTAVTSGNECAVNDLSGYRQAVGRDDNLWRAVKPFSAVGAAVAEGFETWGATITSIRQQNMLADLDSGQFSLNFGGDYHQDYDRMELADGQPFCVRLLCASSLPTLFVDATAAQNAKRDIEGLKTQRGWIHPQIEFDAEKVESYAASRGSFFKPGCGAIVVFDGSTLHKAQPAINRQSRALLNIDIEMVMPTDTMQRIRKGQQPKFALAPR